MRTETMKAEIRKELTDHIIPFWLSLKDEENGGFYGFLSYELKLDKKADKGCILNSRILWFFSHAYDFFRKEMLSENPDASEDEILGREIFHGNSLYPACSVADLKNAATHAYRFLKEAMLDLDNGGVYWSVTYEGIPSDTQKHTYNQAFAIYGLAAYYEISGEQKALDTAYALMNIIEEKCSDKDGYLEAFTIDFKPRSNEELSENGVEATRTMNSLLHCFECYTELYRVDKQEKVKEKLCEIANRFTEKFYNPEKTRQEVFFDSDYNSLIDLHSYGHDIETSWLMEKGIRLIGDSGLTEKMTPMFRAMEEHVYEAAFDGTALYNECENGVNDTKRIWWVECEAVIGFLNRGMLEIRSAEGAALKDSSEEGGEMQNQYLLAAAKIWEYIRDHIVDPRPGSEWLSEVNTENVPFTKKPIVEEWKCPYHNGRMCLEVLGTRV